MFVFNNIILRPLEISDLDSMYTWMSDIELCLWGGWTSIIEGALSREGFRPLFEQHFVQNSKEQVNLGIELEQRLVGFVQLAMIDYRMRRANVGICIGERNLWGQGIGTTALRLLLDYAFTVKDLERISAEVYRFNQHSQKLMERVGFQREGMLRQYDVHNGRRQDTFIFGMLKSDFYQKYETVFHLGSAEGVSQERGLTEKGGDE